ncbi:MAG: hypothetical protein HOK98_07385 [Rhodospirillaceae bacterium]|jgi:hypothetical protein|nr:hypothetical protein [Rhodospirillaceae bacterium]MBT6403609.1 hypothetical protein [Rhodospirillaceae bacterium]MBT6535991.1 hypothetical protein [Rhodospirillaceae bacterium]
MERFQVFAWDRRCWRVAALVFCLGLAACASPHQKSTPRNPDATNPVTVVAFGDMPYRKVDIPAYEQLLRMISAEAPDVTINVGDIKGGGPCDEAIYLRQRDYMNSVDGPLVYTPGDNEWTDCHRRGWGDYDPRERLAVLRDLFFAAPESLGRDPITLERQSDRSPVHQVMVENARWRIGGVLFATAHVVGSNNGRRAGDTAAIAEFERRDAANIEWINELFEIARADRSTAVVLAFQADPYLLYGLGGGFHATLAAITEGAIAFGGPVLVIHGDGHVFTVDTPFQDVVGNPLDNVWRVEVPGALDIRAVQIRIDPDASRIFDVAAF